MATAFLSPIGNGIIPFFTSQGVILAGGQLFTYLAGTTTPQATWTTSNQAVQNSNPIILGSNGLPPQEIWLQQGQAYKFVLEDANSNVLATYDNISGINDISNVPGTSEWVTSTLVPTYSSGTQFTLPGNQTALYPAGQRVKAQVSAGVVYGTVTSSAFSSVTTVNLYLDSGALDSGLASVAYGLTNASHSSTPPNSTASAHVTALNVSSQSITGSFANVTGWTTGKDQLANFNASTGTFTAPTTGYYFVSASFLMSGTFVASNEIDATIVVNGSLAALASTFTTSNSLESVAVQSQVYMLTGTTMNIQLKQNSGNACALVNSSGGAPNNLSIFQVS